MNRAITKEKAEVLFREHADYIYRISLFLTKSEILAEDVVQETFLRIFEKYHTYDASRPIKPWIYKITLNITRNVYRKQKWLGFFRDTPDSADPFSVEGAVLKSEADRTIWDQISQLSFKCREMIVLHYYSGMKLDEIAKTLDIPLGTCKSRLSAALMALRKRLEKYDLEVPIKGGEIYEGIPS